MYSNISAESTEIKFNAFQWKMTKRWVITFDLLLMIEFDLLLIINAKGKYFTLFTYNWVNFIWDCGNKLEAIKLFKRKKGHFEKY